MNNGQERHQVDKIFRSNVDKAIHPESEKLNSLMSGTYKEESLLPYQQTNPLASVESMNTRTLGVGIETMDQMEMLNSLNYTLLNKNSNINSKSYFYVL